MPVLTLENNTHDRLMVTVYLPKEYCPADGIITGVREGDSLISLEGEGLWWLNTIRRSDNGIKVIIEGVFEEG